MTETRRRKGEKDGNAIGLNVFTSFLLVFPPSFLLLECDETPVSVSALPVRPDLASSRPTTPALLSCSVARTRLTRHACESPAAPTVSTHPPMSSRLASNGTRVVQSDRSSDGSTLQPLEAAARTAERIQRTHRLHAPEADTGFRLNLTVEEVPTVGPGSYDPRMTLTASASPRADFGLAHRFLPSKVGYISPRHNSDLLCTASPGPKYHVVPTAATYPRPPALGWGEKLSAEQREKKAALIAASNDATDVGPAGQTHTHQRQEKTRARTWNSCERGCKVDTTLATTASLHQADAPHSVFVVLSQPTRRASRTSSRRLLAVPFRARLASAVRSVRIRF